MELKKDITGSLPIRFEQFCMGFALLVYYQPCIIQYLEFSDHDFKSNHNAS